MWKVLAPLIVLIVVLLVQLQVAESFVASSTGSTTSTDASGNPIDASGNVITKTTTQAPTGSTIALTLSDLLALFKAASTPAPSAPSASSAPVAPVTEKPKTTAEIYSEIQPKLMSDITGVMNTYMSGSPYTPSAPIPSMAPCSDAAAQGIEYQNAMHEYIKKDEIPCYGCTL